MFSKVYLLLFIGMFLFGCGFYFFHVHTTSDKKLKAWESRNENKNCMPHGDYIDAHDLWHILSGVGLIFFCLAIYYINQPLSNNRYTPPQPGSELYKVYILTTFGMRTNQSS